MNPVLIAQILQLFQWAAAGLIQIKNADGTDGQFAPVLRAALEENRPLTAEEWAPIEELVNTATQNALNA